MTETFARWRSWWPLACATACLAAALAAQNAIPDHHRLAAFLFIAAALLFVVLVSTAQRVDVPFISNDEPRADSARQLLPVLATTVPPACAVLFLFHYETWPWFLDGLWVLSIVVGLWWAWRLDGRRRAARAEEPWLTAEFVVLWAILVGATALRIWQVPDLPPVFEDEGHGLRDAHLVLEGTITTPFTNGHSSTGTIFEFILAGYLKAGVPPEVALKLMGIVPGVLMVLVLYLLLREMFGRQVAAIGAFLAATSSWQLMLTRWGHVYGFDELFVTAGLYFVVRGFRTLMRLDFALAGLSFGLGLVLMKSATTAPLMLVAIAGLLVWRLRRRTISMTGQHLVFLALLLGLAFAPRALFVAQDPAVALDRPREVFLFNDAKWAQLKHDPFRQTMQNMKELALAFNVDGGFLQRWNADPNGPALDVVTAALLVLGVAYALFRLRDWRFFVLIALAAAVLVPAATALPLDDRPVTYRLAGAASAVYGLAAVAAWALYAAQRTAVGRAAAAFGLAALFAFSAYANFDVYFHDWGENLQAWYMTGQVDTRVGRHVKSLDGRYHIYVTENTVYLGTVEAIAWRVPYQRITPQNIAERAAAAPVDGMPLAFVIVEPSRHVGPSQTEQVVATLRGLYPQGKLVPGERDPVGQVIYSTFYVERTAARQ